MTSTTSAPSPTSSRTFAPGTAGFTIVLSMAIAATALSIDAVLPALPAVRDALDMPADSNSPSLLITWYFLGSSLAFLPAGLLADRFGRRTLMWGGFALYVLGAAGAALAPNLALMLAARFVWGVGAAGPRVAALAMVRDVYEGEQMAKQMSFIMAVFILVPTFAPSLATGVLEFAPWQAVFVMCGALGVVGLLSVGRLPETLAVERRRSISPTDLWSSCRSVFATPGTVPYLVSLTVLFGVFMSYLASSESIIDEVFDRHGWWFPVWFGGLGVVMGAMMVFNGKLVDRLGLQRMTRVLFAGYALAAATMLVVAISTDGRPPFWLFTVIMAGVVACHGVLIPNLNSAAMRPLGAMAGTAAAMLGMVPGVLGSVIGSLIDRHINGSITPLAVGFAASSIVGYLAWRWAVAVQRGTTVAA